ncbi:MAG: S1 RNA-binding domain-containing protein, partial [Geminicoccaceae bacterium]|nr:S1 RNA-binding domain-containing protein [Geminicoccaceae bacterium]
QTQDNPWDAFLAEHPRGSMVEGPIRNITEFGLFIGLDNGVDGMVHLSDLDWSKPGDEAIKDYKKGDTVKAVVLDVDVEKERISLGMKQLEADPFKEAVSGIKRGDRVTCTVKEVNSGGIEVETTSGAVGFIRKVDLSRDRDEQRPDRYAVGEKVDAKVTNIDATSRRMTLSIRAMQIEDEKQAMADYGSSDSGASLGDILGAAIRQKQETSDD